MSGNAFRSLVVGLILIGFTFLAPGYCLADGESGGSAVSADNFIQTGAATASVAIKVPPARLDMAPQLSINYSSQNDDGWLGLGWALDVSSIQRNTTAGVDYTKNDFVFKKDGSWYALVNIGGNEYRAKIESGGFMRFFYENGAWKVLDKKGFIYYFGSTASSRQDNSYGTFKWCIDRVQDSNGNFMTLAYWKDQGEIYLNRIDYAGNANTNLGAANSVKFYLEPKTDVHANYLTNSMVVSAYRLKTIVTSAANGIAGAYKLTYISSAVTGRSLLSAVQQFGTDVVVTSQDSVTGGYITGGTSLPAKTFSYAPELTSFAGGPSTSIGNNDPTRCDYADFNGDGRMDAVWFGAQADKWVSLATESGFATPTYWTTFGNADPQNTQRHFFADVTGDGKADSIYVQDNGTVYVAPSTGSSFGTWTPWIQAGNGDASRYFFVDVNGDGKADLVYIEGSGNIYVALSTGAGFSNWAPWIYAFGNGNLSYYRFADFDGNGKADVVYIEPAAEDAGSLLTSGNIYVAVSTGSSFVSPYTVTTISDGGKGGGTINVVTLTPRFTSPFAGWSMNQYFLADVNGDGKADLILMDKNTTNVYVALSDGYSFSSQISWWGSIGNSTAASNHRFRFADINGDGKEDLIFLDEDGGGQIYVAYSTGSYFLPGSLVLSHWGNGDPNRYHILDINGDGKQDFLFNSGAGGQYSATTVPGPANKLVQVSNGYGGITSFSYLPSSHYSNLQLPYVFYVVSSVTINDGNGNISTSTYDYADGYHDFITREFRGFGTVKKTNPDGTTVKTWFHMLDDPDWSDYADFKGRPLYSETRNAANVLLTQAWFVWGGGTAPIGIYPVFVRLNEKTSTLHSGGFDLTSREQYVYDDTNGNLLSQTVSGPDAESITTNNVYQNYGIPAAGSWLWRNTQTTITGSDSGQVRMTTSGYESGTGNMLWKESGSSSSRITMDYWPEGNLKTATNALGKSVKSYFDNATKTYVVRTESPLVNGIMPVETADYDYSSGQVINKTDFNNNITTFEYDVFGRIIRKIAPDTGTNDSGDTITSLAYYDGSGRTVQKVAFGAGGEPLITRTWYDNMGRAYYSAGPFVGAGFNYPQDPGNTSQYPWVQTTFDDFGRPKKVESPNPAGTDGIATANISYSGYSKTVTDADGKRRTERKDYLDRLIGVTEYGDNNALFTTSYQYNAAGNLLRIADSQGRLTTMTYDTLGRKTAMQDPDMGIWQYAYDANGNLLSQTDAKGQITSFEYDALNRVVRKSYANTGDPANNPEVTYTYDSPTVLNGIGRLASISTINATTTFDSYDASGRVLKNTETIAGALNPYVTQSEYDRIGRPVTTIYPDLYSVSYSYYPGTALLKSVIGSDGVTYATNSLYGPAGNIGQINYGNSTAVRYAYDPWTIKLSSIVATRPGSNSDPRNDIINRGYVYSAAGDILKITDYKKGAELGLSNNVFEYNYQYDALHRLTSENSTGGNYQQTYTYDNFGNIVTKSNGTATMLYAYGNSQHIHAVSSISVGGVTKNFDYDANGNMIVGHDFANLASIASRQIAYNADNKPVQIIHSGYGTTSMVYDGNGGRVKKTGPAGTSLYVGQHFEVINGEEIKYIFAGKQRVAKVSTAGTYYYHGDHLNSAAAMTDSNGNIVETSNYEPFGGMREHAGQAVSNYKYTDQQLDPETGLYYYGARYYDPTVGRFVSPDSIVPNYANPQAFNRYAYCLNNPLVYTDPSGHDGGFIETIITGAIIGAIAGGILSGTTAFFTRQDGGQAMGLGMLGGALFGAVGGVGQQTGGILIIAAMHYHVGTIMGAISASMYHQKLEKSMLIGGLSAVGGYLTGQGVVAAGAGHLFQGIAAMGAGGLTGGLSSEFSGGKFGKGFLEGEIVSAYGFLFNCALSDFLRTRGYGGEAAHMLCEDTTIQKIPGTYLDWDPAKMQEYYCVAAPGISKGADFVSVVAYASTLVDGPIGPVVGTVAKSVSVVNEGGQILFCGKQWDVASSLTAIGLKASGGQSALISLTNLLFPKY